MIVTLLAVICNAQGLCIERPVTDDITMEVCLAPSAGGFSALHWSRMTMDPEQWTFKTWRCVEGYRKETGI
jgi:hypothetical protein